MSTRTDSDLDLPFIPGLDNRLYPHQSAARTAAIRAAQRLGPGHRVLHDRAHARGQLPHYHIEHVASGQRVSGHYFYGSNLPRRTYLGRPSRELEGESADQELEALLGRIEYMVGPSSVGSPSPLLRIFTEPLHGAGQDKHARLMAMLERRGVDPKQAGYTYQGLVARDLGDVTAQGILNTGRTPWDMGNRHEVTLEGRNSPFGGHKLAQLGALLRASGTLNLTVPRLSDPAQRQLRGLLTGLSRQQPRRQYGLIVRQTLPPAGR